MKKKKEQNKNNKSLLRKRGRPPKKPPRMLWTRILDFFNRVFIGRKKILEKASKRTQQILIGSESLAPEALAIQLRRLKRLGWSEKELADKFHLDLPDVIRMTKYPGSEGKPRRRGRNLQALDDWQRVHPDIPLPESAPEISALTGIPLSTVYKCLRERQRRFQNWVATLGEIKNPKLFFYTADGKKIFHRVCRDFQWFYNPISNKAVLEVKTFLGDIFTVPIPDRRVFEHAWKGWGAFKQEEERGGEKESGSAPTA